MLAGKKQPGPGRRTRDSDKARRRPRRYRPARTLRRCWMLPAPRSSSAPPARWMMFPCRSRRGEIVALLGENGAGKSTLIKALAGVHTLDAGSIRYRGQDASDGLRHLPIAFIHQDLGLIEWMTVAENICLALGYPRRLGLVDWSAARARAARALAAAGRRYRSRCSGGVAQPHREIAGGDQPRAGGGGGTAGAGRADRQPAGQRGGAAVRQPAPAARARRRHDLRLAPAGRGVRNRRPHRGPARRPHRRRARDRRHQPRGSHPADRRPRTFAGVPPAGAARGSQRGWNWQALAVGDVGPIDCRLHAGEIVGLVGLRGAGQESVGRALFGLAPLTGGRILLDGGRSRRPRRARRCRRASTWSAPTAWRTRWCRT